MGTYGDTLLHPSPDQFWALWLEADGKASFWLRTEDSIDNTAMVYSSTTVNDGKWHHITATYNGLTVSLYIDSVKVAEKSFSEALTAVK